MEKSDDLFKERSFSRSNGRVSLSKERRSKMEVTSHSTGKILGKLTDSTQCQSKGSLSGTEGVGNADEAVELSDPTKVEEILSIDDKLITPTPHNVTVLNHACQQVLKEIERQLLALLKENRHEQEQIQNYLSTNGKGTFSDNSRKGNIKCLGMPYFKDFSGFQPPPNQDVVRKQMANQLLPCDLIEGFPNWSNADAKTLIDSVSSYNAEGTPVDWMKISVKDMENKYSPSECRSKWFMNLNPFVNKTKWNLREMELLKSLSEKYQFQDWEQIAFELGTNRTGLQCCIQYMTHTFPTQGKWTKEEDEELKNLIEKFRVNDYIPWTKVAWHFEGRSLKQCQERYAYHLGDIKKGVFTAEEDFLIVYLAPKLKNFGEVAKFLPNRVATQVRARYEYLVEITMPEFTKEEDQLLFSLMYHYPRKWGIISSHFRNRSRVQCRRRWSYLQRQVKLRGGIKSDSENENDDGLADATSPTQGSSLDAMNYYKLKKNVPKKPSKSAKDHSDAYAALLDYHKNSHKFLYGPKPRIALSQEEREKLVKKMAVTMKSLSVACDGPLSGFDIDSLSENCEFDKEDLDVLKGLNSGEKAETTVSVEAIPPNYMTLVGLRTLTLSRSKIHSLSDSYTEVPAPPPPNKTAEPRNRLFCSDAKKLFKSRLKALFAFPLFLSTMAPEIQKSVHKGKSRKAVKPLSKLRRKEHAKLMSAAYREKLKALNQKSDLDLPELDLSSEGHSHENMFTPSGILAGGENEEDGFGLNKEKPLKKRRSCANENTECKTPLKKRRSRYSDFLDVSEL